MQTVILMGSIVVWLSGAPAPGGLKGSCPPQTRLVVRKVGSWCVGLRSKQKHGPALYRYSTGQKLAAGRYRDGRRQGVWTQWYRTGTKWNQETYQGGVRHGPTRHYYASGQLAWSGRYVRGRAEGRWVFWDQHGQKTETGSYKRGRKVGSWTRYYPHLGTKRQVDSFFANGCIYRIHYDEAGNTNFWVHNVWYSSSVLGGARCKALWKRRGGQ